MKAEITLNRVKIIKDIPTRWEDVTYRQFLELKKCGDDWCKVIGLFTGHDPDIIRKATIKNLDGLLNTLGFINTNPGTYIPKTLLGYEIPKDLGFETIGQLEDIKSELKKMKESNATVDDHLDKYPLWCAVYACKPYDWQKAEVLKDLFYEAPCLEVLGIGNFTLAKLIGLKFNTGLNSRKRNTILKKLKLALTVLRVRLVFTLHSFTWKRKQVINVKS